MNETTKSSRVTTALQVILRMNEGLSVKEACSEVGVRGFKDVDEYKHLVQTIGNLTALEKSINGQCQNKTPDQKVSGGYYEQSLFEDPRRISAQVKNLGVAFTCEDIQKRTKTLTDFCLKRWNI